MKRVLEMLSHLLLRYIHYIYVYLSLCKQRVHSWTEVGVRPVLNSHEIFLLILKPMPKPSSKSVENKII